MKKFKLYSVITIAMVLFCTGNIFAQANTKNDVPATVVAAFTAKYPKAEIKKWDVTNNEYTAKAKGDQSEFYATFDSNSVWVKTTSKVNWSWNLPADVRASLKESKYSDWRVDKLRKVETPNGEFYQVLVDNLFLQGDGTHDGFTQNLVLNFKPAGELVAQQSIKSPLLF